MKVKKVMAARTLYAVLAVTASAIISLAAITAGDNFGPWEAPVNMESIPGTSSEFNTPFNDGCPIQAPDGLSFFMASNRPGGLGGQDIWVARRKYRNDPWGAPENLGAPVNSSFNDFCPTPTSGNRLYFVSDRPGGFGEGDIYITRFENGVWATPQNLGCDVNSNRGEASPSPFVGEDNEVVLYFSSNRAGGFDPIDPPTPDSDIYFSRAFGPAQLVPGLNTASDDSRPNVRLDGLEIVFDSNRPGGLGGPDIYTADRRKLRNPWSAPENLALVNSSANETRASLSRNGRTLVFGSTRPGVEGQADIFVTTRRRGHHDSDDDDDDFGSVNLSK